MTTLERDEDKLKFDDLQHYDQDDINGYCSLNSEKAESPVTPNVSRGTSTTAVASVSIASASSNTPPSLDEKRMRREIANSNERRRMQSINAGFQSLRSLLPHHEGEKLSKAAILQQTADYIYQLEQERTQLLSQNCQLKRIISQHEGEIALTSSPPSPSTSSKKRKITDSSDEDVTSSEEFLELKIQLDRERALRIHLEDKVQRLESIYPVTTVTSDKLQDNLSTEQITLQYHKDEVQIKEESIILASGNSYENRRELHCNDGSSTHNINSDAKRTASASVILQPLTHDESVLSPNIIGGHQYSASPALVNQSACLSTSIKIKPKVEVERLPSPTSVASVSTITSTRSTATTTNSSPLICNNTSSTSEQILPSARVYLTSTSRQNLETIVEAIRHLEGDSLFDSACGTSSSNLSNQEVPLALTKRNSQTLLQVDMNPFLRFHARQQTQTNSTSINTTTEQQQRPGVIVVKQQT